MEGMEFAKDIDIFLYLNPSDGTVTREEWREDGGENWPLWSCPNDCETDNGVEILAVNPDGCLEPEAPCSQCGQYMSRMALGTEPSDMPAKMMN